MRTNDWLIEFRRQCIRGVVDIGDTKLPSCLKKEYPGYKVVNYNDLKDVTNEVTHLIVVGDLEAPEYDNNGYLVGDSMATRDEIHLYSTDIAGLDVESLVIIDMAVSSISTLDRLQSLTIMGSTVLVIETQPQLRSVHLQSRKNAPSTVWHDLPKLEDIHGTAEDNMRRSLIKHLASQ